jgi:hypothetical protein
MMPSPPNTCLIWAMTLKSSRSFIGSSRAGRNSIRNYTAQSLIAAGINGAFSLAITLLLLA